jgi:hypothetical protein
MFQRKITLLVTVSIYILFVGLLFIIQPAMMFDKDGNLKDFDFSDNDATLIPLILALPLLAVIIYLLVLVLEMIMT